MSTDVRALRERNTWDKEAQAYHELQQTKYQDLFNRVIARTRKNLQSDNQVIEIGCGSGLVTFGIVSNA